jgi:hypothetical protein
VKIVDIGDDHPRRRGLGVWPGRRLARADRGSDPWCQPRLLPSGDTERADAAAGQ